MAVAYRSQARSELFGATSHTCSMPAGIVAGDILLMFVTMIKSSGAVPPATPSGWTAHANNNNSQFSVDHNYAVFSKVATGSEGASITLTTSASETSHIVIVAYSGATSVVFVDSGSAQLSTATPTVPSVTTTAASSMIAGVVFANSTASGTPGSGWTERVDDTEGNFGDLIYMMEIAQAAAGASATGQATIPGARNCWTYTFGIQPLAVVQPRPVRINTSGGWVDIADQSSFVSGTGAPTVAVGATGAIYLDTATGRMYGPKAAGAWPSTSFGRLLIPGNTYADVAAGYANYAALLAG